MVSLNFNPISVEDSQTQVAAIFQANITGFNVVKTGTQLAKATAQITAPLTRLLAPAATQDALDATQAIDEQTKLNTKVLTKTYNTLFLQYTIANAVFRKAHPESLADHIVDRLENTGLALVQFALTIVQLAPIFFYSICALFTLFQNEDLNHHAIVETTQLVSHAMLIGIHVIGIFSLSYHHDVAIDYGELLLGLHNASPIIDQVIAKL